MNEPNSRNTKLNKSTANRHKDKNLPGTPGKISIDSLTHVTIDSQAQCQSVRTCMRYKS